MRGGMGRCTAACCCRTATVRHDGTLRLTRALHSPSHVGRCCLARAAMDHLQPWRGDTHPPKATQAMPCAHNATSWLAVLHPYLLAAPALSTHAVLDGTSAPSSGVLTPIPLGPMCCSRPAPSPRLPTHPHNRTIANLPPKIAHNDGTPRRDPHIYTYHHTKTHTYL